MSSTSMSTALLIVATLSSSVALRLNSITVPPKAGVGASVTLECPFVASQSEPLKLVTWYKDDLPFYGFYFDRIDGQISFELEGIDIDLDQSDERQLTLQSLSLASSGNYTCLVMAEAPDYEAVTRTAPMLVWKGFRDSTAGQLTPEERAAQGVLFKLLGMVIRAGARLSDHLWSMLAAVFGAT